MTPKSVFLLAGDEDFLKQEWLKTNRDRFFKDTQGYNSDFDQFYARDSNLSDILSIARTKPFLAKKRLLVLKNIDEIKSESDRNQLLSYAKDPAPETVFILESDTKEKDLRDDKFLSGLCEFAQPVFFKKLYDAALWNWIAKQFAARNKKPSPQVPQLLAQLKGNNLKALNEEIEKLSVYAAGRDAVTCEDVRKLVGEDISGSVYALIDAISQNDKKKAMALSSEFDRNDLGSVVGLLCWNLRAVLRANGSLKDDWRLKRKEPRKIKPAWIELALSELTEFDLKLKTSGFPDPFYGWQVVMARLLGCL